MVLIEALPGGEYDSRHIPGAILIPLDRLRELAPQYLPDTAAEIVVYGESLESSEPDRMSEQLLRMGYHNLYVYRGGRHDWFDASGFTEAVHVPPKPGTRMQFDDSPRRSDSRALRLIRRPTATPAGDVAYEPRGPRLERTGWLGGLRQRGGRSHGGQGGGQGGGMERVSTRGWEPLFKSAVIALAAYGGAQIFKSLQRSRSERRLATDEVSELPGEGIPPSPESRVVKIDENHHGKHDSDLERSADSFHAASAAD